MTNLILGSIGALVGSILFIWAGSMLSHQPILKVPLTLTVQDGSVTRFGSEAFTDIKQGF